MGYIIADDIDNADLIIFNTCAVRENAHDRVFGNVGALKHKKAKNKDLKIIISGCLTQQRDVAEKLKKTFPFIDLVIGTNQLNSLSALLEQNSRGVVIGDAGEEIAEDIPTIRDSKYKANISIMYGCDNYCTYCIVPYVRGRERSRPASAIIKELKDFYSDGCREFLLLGQNVNSYGKTNGESFSELLKMIDVIDGEFIVNFMTSHPKDCTKELIDTIANSTKISRHLHLPVQSGSNRILKLMNRGYTREQYIELCEYAKEQISGLSLTTDIIVGFPGEEYDDFKETLALMEQLKFDSAYTFIYSKRPGTKAATFPDYISDEQKGIWFRELLDVQSKIGDAALKKYIGKTVRVFCSENGRSNSNLLSGKSSNNLIVDFARADKACANEEKIGKFANVKVTSALKWALIGEEIL